jgi:hypothetical protein
MSLPDSLLEISKEDFTWRNATRNVEVTPRRIFFPRHREHISAIVQVAERDGLRVRAVGSGHSYSEVAVEDDYLLGMEHLEGVERVDPDRLKAGHRDRLLVAVQAGTTIRRLNRLLKRMDLALPNMGAVDYQTVSGALMTGTHGSGINKPAFPDMIRAIRLVGGGGMYYQIEPTDGITDPEQPPEDGYIRLIQDDDTFYSTVLSLGAMGIVYELVLEVEETFWMKERRDLMPWTELRRAILEGRFLTEVEQTDFMGFRINPYPIDGDHLCALTRQWIIDKADRPKGLNAHFRNLLSSIGGGLEKLIEWTIRTLNRRPEKAPGRIQTALKFTKDLTFTGRSYRVLFQSGSAVAGRGISSEFAFEVRADLLVGALEAAFQLVDQLAQTQGYYQSSFLSVRFVQASRALLSPTYGRKTFFLDVPLLRNIRGDREILAAYQERMMDLGGIPHWGKINERLYEDTTFTQDQLDDRLARWRAVQKELDPKGTFLSDFILRAGLVDQPVAFV